jgi:hypothetical protein
MEACTPIELLKNKLAELKLIPGVEPNIILEYEKAILVLELIGNPSFDDIVSESQMDNLDSTNHNGPKKEPKSYYERFMGTQKIKNNKT